MPTGIGNGGSEPRVAQEPFATVGADVGEQTADAGQHVPILRFGAGARGDAMREDHEPRRPLQASDSSTDGSRLTGPRYAAMIRSTKGVHAVAASLPVTPRNAAA